MTLGKVLLWVGVIDGVALALTAVALIGPARLRRTVRALPDRLREVALPIAFLAGVLILNALIREPITRTSWIVGINVTPYIYGLEGDFVPWVQSFASPSLTALFSYAYVYGYVYLLVFPLVAYASLDDLRPMRALVAAYSVNYILGLACYVLVVAYGPRNLLTGSVESLLYTSHPQFQFLTSQVNSNTNVFPSLHTSLSATVIGIAYETKNVYPVWLYIAVAVGGSIIVSTMYLGIHWLIDVLAGVLLAAIAVSIGRRYAGLDQSGSRAGRDLDGIVDDD